MQQTKDYDMFKIYRGNRPIDQKNLSNLITSISTENLLKERPIVVNENFEVLDGQHRLEAAKNLQIPITYVIKTGGGCKDVILLNNHQKNWKLDDYLRIYANGEKLHEYLRLEEFMKKHNMPLKTALLVIWGPFKEMKEGEDFKNGKFMFSIDEKVADDLCAKIKYIFDLVAAHNIKPMHRFRNTAFIKPFLIFISNPQLNWVMFQNKLEQLWFKIGTRPSTNLYLEMFSDIYNYRNQNKIIFDGSNTG